MKRSVTIVLSVVGAGLLGGCGTGFVCGSGTHASAGMCVVDSPDTSIEADAEASLNVDATDATDAPPDDGATDASPDGGASDAPTNPGGFLMTRHSGVLRGVPGLLSCLDGVTPVRNDGTMLPMPAPNTLTVTTADPSIAVPAMAVDCAQVGVVGVAAGTTTLMVRFVDAGVSYTGTFAVRVEPYVYRFQRVDASVPIGAGRLYPDADLRSLRIDVLDGSGQTVAYPVAGESPEALPRWVTLSLADSTHALITQPSPRKWLVQGLVRGVTSVNVAYAAPGAPMPGILGSLAVGVPTLSSLSGLQLLTDDGLTALSPGRTTPPGSCVLASPLGNYSDGTTAVVLQGVTWSTSSPSISMTGATPARFCTSTVGDAWIGGCVSGPSCVRTDFIVATAGSIRGVAIRGSAPTPVFTQGFNGRRGYCPPLGASAMLSDGTNREETASGSIFWNVTPMEGTMHYSPLERLRDSAGVPMQDPGGNPCFAVTAMTPPLAGVMVVVQVAYGDSTAGSMFTAGP